MNGGRDAITMKTIQQHWKPTLQTKFGTEGNCFAAVVATMYPVSIDEIPYIEDSTGWQIDISKWSRDRLGVGFICLGFQDSIFEHIVNCPLIVLIKSKHPDPAIVKHAVIGKGGNIIFDPMIGEVNIPIVEEHEAQFIMAYI